MPSFLLRHQTGSRSDRKQFSFLIILDCCRTPARRGTPAYGPVCVGPLANTFVAYACALGKTSSDNTRERNGLYTKHLLKHTTEPDQDINALFRAVCKDVWHASGETQEPWYSEALKMECYCLCPRA
jgi:hypothetical protein